MENSENFIRRIREENIKPIPRWRFTARNSMIWVLVFLSVIVGAISFSVILFVIQQIEFNLIAHMTHSRLEMWLGLLPFLWIILLIVFILISIFGIKKTRKGYKFRVSRIVGANIIFSILLGTMLFLGGGARWLENAFEVNMSFYEGINDKKIKMWSKPEQGYLAGTIEQVYDTSFMMKDFEEKEWEVVITHARIFEMVDLAGGEKVKIMGSLLHGNKFIANEVRPWGGFGQQGRKRGTAK